MRAGGECASWPGTDAGYQDLTDTSVGFCRQILSLGEHNGQGVCLCTVDEDGYLALDDYAENIIHPGCPMPGHRRSVDQVQSLSLSLSLSLVLTRALSLSLTLSHTLGQVRFSDDSAQVISCDRDEHVFVWDVSSGTPVCQLEGVEFAFAEGPFDQHKKHRHVLTSRGDTLLIYKVAKEQQHVKDVVAGAPVACFKAPQRINSFRCHGAAICVGCNGGAVCILQAPFLGA